MKSIFPLNSAIKLPGKLTLVSILSISITACGGGSDAPVLQSAGLSTYQSASVVIGQADFAGIEPNQNSTADANTIFIPSGNVAVGDTGILYLSDSGNNRLLGFNSVPTVNNQVANFALGQPDLVSTTSGVTASTLFGPQQVILDIENDQMFLVDYSNDRILIWNSIPESGGVGTDVAADVVLGQTDLVSNTIGCSASQFDNIESVSVKAGRIFATDSGNNRVLIWRTIPTTHGAAADIVLGQQNFTNCAPNDSDGDGVTDLDAFLDPVATSFTLDSPAGVWSDGSRIVVLDSDNNRALIWNTFPSGSSTPADVVLGQGDFSHITTNDDDQNNTDDGAASARTMNLPYLGVYSDNIRLFITDTNNNRVLVWNQFPLESFTPADVVLGQSDFTGTAENAGGSASARTLSSPGGVFQSGEKLIVTDSGNHRYLIFNDPL